MSDAINLIQELIKQDIQFLLTLDVGLPFGFGYLLIATVLFSVIIFSVIPKANNIASSSQYKYQKGDKNTNEKN